jgi:hypothetical protein
MAAATHIDGATAKTVVARLAEQTSLRLAAMDGGGAKPSAAAIQHQHQHQPQQQPAVRQNQPHDAHAMAATSTTTHLETGPTARQASAGIAPPSAEVPPIARKF